MKPHLLAVFAALNYRARRSWSCSGANRWLFLHQHSNLTSISPADPLSPAPPGGAEGLGERAEGGQGGHLLVRELWFIVVMTAVALLLLAIVLGVALHKV